MEHGDAGGVPGADPLALRHHDRLLLRVLGVRLHHHPGRHGGNVRLPARPTSALVRQLHDFVQNMVFFYFLLL